MFAEGSGSASKFNSKNTRAMAVNVSFFYCWIRSWVGIFLLDENENKVTFINCKDHYAVCRFLFYKLEQVMNVAVKLKFDAGVHE